MLHSRDSQPGAVGGVSRGSIEQVSPTPARVVSALLACACLAMAARPTRAVEDPLPAVASLVDRGAFADAGRRIDAALADGALAPATRDALAFERERMRRIRLDFPLDEAAARERLRAQVPDLRDDEFDRWTRAGQLEHLVIDGEPRYFARAVSNLFLLSPDAAARRARPATGGGGPMESPHPHHAEALAQARATGASSVAPRRVRVTQSLVVEADAVPAGETVRAWIPYPRAIPGQQDGLRLHATTPAQAVVAPEDTRQRTVYLEQRAVAGQPTRFAIDYELTVHAQVHAIDPDSVVPVVPTDALAEHLGERPPHIVFSDGIRAFSARVVGDETNPYRVARKLFEAVDRIPWAGAREYSTIRNIPHYVLATGHGDCGQQTLLLMTLLRLNGIPARWQSGMVFSDGDYDNLHDWGWMYLAPYGWLPMDVTTGRFAGERDPGLEWFYFGGLDAYRIAFNDDYGTPLVPPKQHFRSETVDSQRGEAEWRGGNLYFDQWDYTFEAKVLPPSPGH